MQVIGTALAGVKIITPDRHGDERGWFSETWRESISRDEIADLSFVQDNESFSAIRYTVRGLHYQAPPAAQAKLVRCTAGSIFDVAVDIRRSSPTYGQWIAVELSAENGKQIFVPEGFLHGFMTLTEDVRVSYKVSAYYDRAADGAVYWASAGLGIDWPVGADRATVSDKDRAAPAFDTFATPFA